MAKMDVADPTLIDWATRQRDAAIPFFVVAGRPVNPFAPTGTPRGRGELRHWGERRAADAVVFARYRNIRHLLMIRRGDGHGWGVPGGGVDPGETPLAAAIRELREEAGLDLARARWKILPVRYVPDPRASDEAWMVTWPAIADLGVVSALPVVKAADDADQAAWIPADRYGVLVAHLAREFKGRVFAAHEAMLQDLLR